MENIRTIPRPLIRSDLARALLISQGLVLLWWLAALWLKNNTVTPIWYDQTATFLPAGMNLSNPYTLRGYFNPPWAAVLMLPFSFLPLLLATLAQSCLYFALLTGVIFKFGGKQKHVVIALSGFVALDAVNQLNIDWMVCIGL